MNQAWLNLLKRHRAIAVIRASSLEVGQKMAHAVAAGGMSLIEITWNSQQAFELIGQLRSELPACTIGAGTLLTIADVRAAIAAGAQYLFTPHVDPTLIQAACRAAVPLTAGALTPSEIIQAWQAGASSVKVFPVQAVGGAEYIRCLQGPLGDIPLVPTGGVTLANAEEFLQAGAIAVGLSGNLFPRQAIVAENWQIITEQAAHLVNKLGLPSLSSGASVCPSTMPEL